MASIPKVVTEAPYWRTAPADQYARQQKIRNAPPYSVPPMTPVSRPTWRYPQRVTVYSTLTPVIDPSAAPFHNVVTDARARLRVEYGDAGQVFRRDVPVGVPFEVCASYIDVKGYIDPLGNRIFNAIPVATSSLETTVTVAVVEGGGVELDQGQEQESETCKPGVAVIDARVAPSFLHSVPFEYYGPVTLHSLMGFQASGGDLYVQLYDWSIFHIPPLASTIADGAVRPRFEFKAVDGQNFSAVFDGGGIFFQHGLQANFSSTPFVLTRVDPTTIPFRANWRHSILNLPVLNAPRVLP